MNYEQTRQRIESRGKKWNDFIAYMQDKPYDIDPKTHFIDYKTKYIISFLNHHERTDRTGA